MKFTDTEGLDLDIHYLKEFINKVKNGYIPDKHEIQYYYELFLYIHKTLNNNQKHPLEEKYVNSR